jgi:hypothetical protein
MGRKKARSPVGRARLLVNGVVLGAGGVAIYFLLRAELPWLGGTMFAAIVVSIIGAVWGIVTWLVEGEVKDTSTKLLQRPRVTVILIVVVVVTVGGILFAGRLYPAHDPALRLLPYGATLASYLPKPDSPPTGRPSPQLEVTIGDDRHAWNDVTRKALYVGRGEWRVKWLVTNEEPERRKQSICNLLDVSFDDAGAASLIRFWMTDPPDVRDAFVAPRKAIHASLHIAGRPPIALTVTPSTVTSTKDIVDVLMEIK